MNVTARPPVYERSIPAAAEFEFRANGDGMPRFYGYAAVFNSDSEPLPFVETIMPGAFARSLANGRDHTLVLDHNDTQLLASRRAKTLTLTEDSKGLLVEADLPNTSYARDLVELHSRGEARSMSFTFRVTKGGETWSADNKRRTLTDVRLGHVSVLTGLPPAYRQTTASIRSLANLLGTDAEEVNDVIDAVREGRSLGEADCDLLTRIVGSLAPADSRWSSAANDASSATYALAALLSLLGNESDDAGQSALLKTAIDALQAFIAAETAEIGTDADLSISRGLPLTVARARLALLAKAR